MKMDSKGKVHSSTAVGTPDYISPEVLSYGITYCQISLFLEGIQIEHTYEKCSSESQLFFISICFIRIPSRNRVIVKIVGSQSKFPGSAR